MEYKLQQGDNIELLKKLPDNSIDSIVTDPPYGLSFMNKKWDYDVPSVELWREIYRVLKPGGHVLSFGGTRTYHRMVVNMEDAGFEIRDQIMWLYGSGFPKSHNISKAIDKVEGNERKVVGRKIQRVDGTLRNVGSSGAPFLINGVEGSISKPTDGYIDIEEPGSENSKRYAGWGTALKPANEPICVARKPLSEKSVALNVLKWGTGGINIDGCRVGSELLPSVEGKVENNGEIFGGGKGKNSNDYITPEREGRFPANIILECICDEVIKGEKGDVKSNTREAGNSFNNYDDKKGKVVTRIENYNDKGDIHTNPMCPCRLMDEQSGISKSIPDNRKEKKSTGEMFGTGKITNHNDKGGASRFFYQAKVSKKERNMGLDGFEEKESQQKGHGLDRVCMNEGCGVSMLKPELCKCDEPDWRPRPKKNSHPTVKPVSLMAYLCRLVTPPGGTILDPYMGSGSTGIAALLEGFNFIGMDLDPEYVKIAEARIKNYEKYREFLKK